VQEKKRKKRKKKKKKEKKENKKYYFSFFQLINFSAYFFIISFEIFYPSSISIFFI
jgi:hypothetical protein